MPESQIKISLVTHQKIIKQARSHRNQKCQMILTKPNKKYWISEVELEAYLQIVANYASAVILVIPKSVYWGW